MSDPKVPWNKRPWPPPGTMWHYPQRGDIFTMEIISPIVAADTYIPDPGEALIFLCYSAGRLIFKRPFDAQEYSVPAQQVHVTLVQRRGDVWNTEIK